jgi:four helix bundle protein
MDILKTVVRDSWFVKGNGFAAMARLAYGISKTSALARSRRSEAVVRNLRFLVADAENKQQLVVDHSWLRGAALKNVYDTGTVIRDYKDLRVWQKGMDLAKLIYQITGRFPTEEKFGITAQMRRAAVSVPSNIAEGQARKTTGEFVQFLSHAEGSLAELDTQLRLSVSLAFCEEGKTEMASSLITDLQKMLNGLRAKLAGESRTTNHEPRTTLRSEE